MKTCLFGLLIESNVDLPGFAEVEGVADVTLTLDCLPRNAEPKCQCDGTLCYVSPYKDTNGLPYWQVDQLEDGTYRISHSDHSQFVVSADGRVVHGTWYEPLVLEDAIAYFLGSILGFVLHLKDITVLHASAVNIDGRAVLFTGSQGAGKSTTAAAFIRRGFAVLADDAAALTVDAEAIMVHPGTPRLLLCSSSVEPLWGRPDFLPPVSPTWDKNYLNLQQPGYQFCRRPVPLGAIYILAPRATDLGRCEFEPVMGTAALLQLTAQNYALRRIDVAGQARDLKFLAEMLKSVPLRILKRPEDTHRLDQLCAEILDDYRSLRHAGAA